jgi:hypothetical protein
MPGDICVTEEGLDTDVTLKRQVVMSSHRSFPELAGEAGECVSSSLKSSAMQA